MHKTEEQKAEGIANAIADLLILLYAENVCS